MAATIAKVSARGAKKYYYEKDPIFNNDGNGENLEWSGKQAEFLGLEGMATKEEFGNLLEGKNKDGSVQLKQEENKVAAYDLTFAAPKSVSILALNGDEKLIEAHKKAVDKALSYAEQNFANAKVWKTNAEGKRERVVENQSNLLVAKALHSTNRNLDPHLHTHSLIFNQVFVKSEGKFKALAAQELFKNQKTLDNIYKSELAKEVQKLGYKIEKQENGGWEIAIKDSLKEEFSSRRAEILAKAEETGAETVKEKVHIQHMLKAEKTDITKEELMKNWEKTINKHYSSKEEMFAQAKVKEEEKISHVKFSSEKEVLEFTGKLLSENEATWTEKQLLSAASELAAGQYSYLDLKEELNNVKKIGQKNDSELKLLGENEKGEKVFTNKEMYELEKENINMLKNQKNFEALMTKEEATEALQSFEQKFFKLNEGQYNTVFNLLTGKDQFQAIQGVAGAGKTSMLKAFNYTLNYKNNNADITLLAPTNKAAQGAKTESKIGDKEFKTKTVAKHILQTQNNQEVSHVKEGEKNVKDNRETKKISHVKFGEKGDKNLSSANFTAKNKKNLTEAELYVKSGHSVFNKDSRTFLLNAANSFGIKLNKNLEGVYITKARNKITRQTKINVGQFKGAIKREEIDFLGDSISYKSNIRFKDGSEYRMQVENWNGANKLMATLFNVKSTKIQDTQKGENLKQTEVNLTALKLTHKKVDKAYAQQRKLELSFAGLVKASINKTKFNLRSDLQKEQTAKSLGILGFSVTTIKEELKDKEGNTISLKTQKEKKFLGFTIKKETEVKNIKDNRADLKISNEIKEEKISHVKFQDKNKKNIEEKSTQEFKDINKEKALKIAEDNAKIQKSEKMIIIDEASMLSARDLNKILKDAKENNVRVVFMGDTKQLQSIGAGRAFEQIQKHTRVSTMPESLRQHTKVDKTIADSARMQETISKSFRELQANNRIKEFKDQNEKLKAAAKAAVREELLKGEKFGKAYEKQVSYKDTLVLANTRKENNQLNTLIREELKQKGILKTEESINVKVLEQKNMSAIKQATAANFKKDQIIRTFKSDQTQMKIGQEYQIKDIDKVNNTLTLLNKKDNNEIKINVKDFAGQLNVFEKKDLELSKNDIIVITKTDKKQNLLNSERGVIVGVDKEKKTIDVDFGDKGIKKIDLSKGDIGLDYGYSLTTYKAQGVTVDKAIVVSNTSGNASKMNNLNNFYVAVSRQKLKVEVYTDNVNKLQKQVGVEQQKTSTLDFSKATQDLQKQHTQNLNNLIKQANNNIKEGINTQTQQKLQKLAQNAQKQQSQKNPEKQEKVGFETENKQNQENVKNQEQQAKNARIQAF